MSRLVIAAVLVAACAPERERHIRRPVPVVPATIPAPDASEPTTPATPDIPAGPQLVQGGVQSCANPAARELALWDPVEVADPAQNVQDLVGSGMVVADLTGNGRLDLFLPGVAGPQLWVQQDDGTLVDEAAERLKSGPLAQSVGASAADYDGDGDLDLVVFREGRSDRLLRNFNGIFRDVTANLGFSTGEGYSVSASWADYDGDGDLDVFVSGYDEYDPSWLLRNEDGEAFTDQTAQLPEPIGGAFTFMGSWIDLQLDGYPDLFVPNDFFKVVPCALIANQGGVLTLDRGAGYHPNFHGMGIAFGDFNGDGLPDPVETSFRRATVLLSQADEAADQGLRWVDWSLSMDLGIQAPDTGREFGWGVDVGDIDNDGDEDVAMGWGFWSPFENTRLQADGVWLHDPAEGRFVSVYGDGWDAFSTRGVLLVDFDGDGWLDLIKRVVDAPSLVYDARCGEGSWLSVSLEQPGMNRFGIGATVIVEAGGRSWRRWVEAGSRSMFSGGPPQVHFGLGEVDQVDRLEVIWPDAERTVFRDAFPARQHVKVVVPTDEEV